MVSDLELQLSVSYIDVVRREYGSSTGMANQWHACQPWHGTK